jgi:Zn-dependent metalloprotease
VNNCPCCFIIPNDIAREMARNAEDAEDRDLALDQISRNSKMREHRKTLMSFRTTALTKGGERRVYDAKSKSRLPGALVRSESDKKSPDDSVNDVFLSSGIVRDFLIKVLGHDGYDGANGDLTSTVHYLKNYNNAFWDGEQMVYGDGDGKFFGSFTNDLEIAGHEIFHGVITATSGLVYQGESGALNESCCDVFGSLVKQWQLQQSVEQADWIIGKGLFTKAVKGVGVRKLDAPGRAFNDPVLGRDNTRGHYSRRYKGSGDYGGVHINSGIPSLAFVTAAKQYGGKAWEQMGLVWWKTLTSLNSGAKFQDAAIATLRIAKSLYPEDRNLSDSIQAGWKEVGVM